MPGQADRRATIGSLGGALRVALALLALAGLGLATYLTYLHYSGGAIPCTSSGCETVQTSIYSKLAGVPVALMGAIGYLLILGSIALPEREETRFATLALALVGFGFSVYLTGRELFSIHAICEWCVGSASIMTVILIISLWRFLTGGAPAGRVDGQFEELEVDA